MQIYFPDQKSIFKNFYTMTYFSQTTKNKKNWCQCVILKFPSTENEILTGH